MPYFMMGIHLNRFSPFICDLGDLETTDIFTDSVKKRQIIAPFDARFYYSKQIQWRPSTPDRLVTFEKSQLKLKRLLAKVSYNDV
jgi:hypothetical protein